MFRPSTVSLILVNLIPLAGVLFFEWNVAAVVLLFWFENVVVGIFNVLKMNKAQGTASKARLYIKGKSGKSDKKSFIISFFILHFGIFTAVHGVFVLILFIKDLPSIGPLLWAGMFLFLSHGRFVRPAK